MRRLADNFAALLRQHRLSRSLTQEQLAERAALSAAAVAALERGRSRRPRLTTIRQLGRALDLTPGELATLAGLADVPTTSTTTDATRPAAVRDLDGDDGASPGRGPTVEGASERRGARRIRASGQMGRTALTGREPELASLIAAVDGGGATFVTGEAGIGKTRLVAEAVGGSDPGGRRVAWGTCSEDFLGPYEPFAMIVRDLAGRRQASELSGVTGIAELTWLAPELEVRLGVSLRPARTAAATDERHLFEAVAALVALSSPMTLVIDDAQWADDASLRLLSYLVSRGSASIVVTARLAELEAHRPGYVGELERRAGARHIRLGGLTFDQLGRLVTDVLSSSAAPSLVAVVGRATDGNPFFAEELSAHLLDNGSLEDGPEGMRLRPGVEPGVPSRVRAMLAGRLRTLGPAAIELLRVGSLLGRDFDAGTAAAAAGLDTTSCADAVDDALLSGLVVESPPSGLAFVHSLVQEALVTHMSHVRRVAVHRRLAEMLGQRDGSDPESAADILRHWLVVSEFDPACMPLAATWAVRAGDAALASAAPAEAISRYEQATELWSASSAGLGDALVRLGDALRYAGRHEEADERYRQAQRIAEALELPELLTRAALGTSNWVRYWETDDERVELLERAIRVMDPRRPILRTALEAVLASQMAFDYSDEAVARYAELEASVSRAVSDPDLDPDLLLALGQSRLYVTVSDPELLREVTGRLVTVARERGDVQVLKEAYYASTWSALERADMAALKAANESYTDCAVQLEDVRDLAFAAANEATMATIEARFVDAERHARIAVDRGLSIESPNAEVVFFIQTGLLEFERGNPGAVLAALEALPEYQRLASFRSALAFAAAAAGDVTRAKRVVDEMTTHGTVGVRRGVEWVGVMAFLAEACVRLGDRTGAARLYPAFSTSQVDAVRLGPLAGWWGPVAHHLGALALLLGRHADACAHLERALEIERAMGARSFEARSQVVLSRTLLETPGAPETTRARDLAVEARATSSALGCSQVSAEAAELCR